MKALFVNPGKSAYGSGQSMLGLLENRRFDAEVVCPGGGPLEESLRKMGVKHHALEFGKYAALRRPDWQFAFYRQFRHILKVSRPDVLIINLDGNTPLVTLAAVRLGIPIIRFSRFEFKAPRRWVDKWCWLKASALICPSELVKQQVLAWAPKDFQPRVQCWYDPHMERPLSDAEIQKAKAELGLGADKVIIYVGRLHPLKRIETAIRALAEVRKVIADVRLLIVGSHDGSVYGAAYEQSLRDLTAQLGLQAAVQFLGYLDRDNVPVTMTSANVCVLPSESESFGMVLTEAWSVQKPTVASDVGGCHEITLASGGGYLAPVGDVKIFAGHLIKLLSDSALARRHGLAGEAWVKANCDSKAYAGRFEQLIKTLAKTDGARAPLRALTPVTSMIESRPAPAPATPPGPKVCIATFYHESHPGAVLQAYALSKTLSNLGYSPELVAYRRPIREGNANALKQKILKVATRASFRDAEYQLFRSKFLKETSEIYHSYEALASHPPAAAAYVCGSDQIWNPALLARRQYDPAYFLQFGAESTPRISYAASFGGHQPDEVLTDQLRKYLSQFNHISVRELEGQACLKKILGREIGLTLDPTLLPDNYHELITPSTGSGEHVLIYALQHSPEIHAVARETAAYMNKPLWSCGGSLLPWKRAGKRQTEEGPLKWLERINEASVVVTNSYHGMIFSLLLRKRVIVVPLQGSLNAANVRLFHLCDTLGIREQVMPVNLRGSLAQEMDWNTFDSNLAEQRAASLAFLRSALPKF